MTGIATIQATVRSTMIPDNYLNSYFLIPMVLGVLLSAGLVFSLLLPAEKRTTKSAFGVLGAIFAIPALLFAGMTLSVQNIKAEALAAHQANAANEKLQRITAYTMMTDVNNGKGDPIVETALSGAMKDPFSAEVAAKLNRGETISFKADNGKPVELKIEPGTQEGRINVVLTYNGQRVNNEALTNVKPLNEVGKDYAPSWIDTYPTLVKAPTPSV